jgi:sporulation protein YlmC with PRC-barrel domain
MRLSLLTATAASALLLCQAGAMAETNTPISQPNAKPPVNTEQSITQKTRAGLRTQLRDMLQREGFTDIHVVPSSFMVRAKDKNGDPVVMSVSPDSFTEVAEVGSSSFDDSAATKTMGDSAGAQFVSIPDSDELSSNVVGLDVYNTQNKSIGQIKDVALNQRGRAQAYIVSVGGFLGMGEHYVAVNPANIQVTYNESDKKWHAEMSASAEQLKAAPEFKYTGRWNASKS